ncbi:MAG: stage II sporulation protein M [Candidatus Altiarchaeota archaeon]|nr:stage II sporulation protein M [Candidatus Altiarchaeota archaeon]
MVLESIIKPPGMEKNPLEMLVVGFFYSTLGLFLALYIFGEESSLAGVFLTTIPLVVVMMNTLRFEEKKDMCIHEERFLIKEHGKALSMFFCLFMGMVLSYSFWVTVLPQESMNDLFDFQIDTLGAIQRTPDAVGNAIAESRNDDLADFVMILENNFNVLVFCLIFSLLYGAGAIFILALNASVIGVAVGTRVRDFIAECAFKSHLDMIYNYFNYSASITLCYMLHGVFEISAYIVAALAGGIISVAVVNHDFRTKEFWHIVVDSSDLVILSILLLVAGAVVEVYVTPEICVSNAVGRLIESVI